MKINNHRLWLNDQNPAEFRSSPNQAGSLDARYLVIHFTAGRNKESSVQWFLNPNADASAHLVIGRDGTITQMVPFDKIAWHAGASRWEGLDRLNRYSIGIELDNAGKLTYQNEKWMTWFGGTIPKEEVLIAQHKDGSLEAGWHMYTPEQLEALVQVSVLLVKTYKLKDVIGHDDISPFRKSDPGPAFPMASFNAKVMGRNEDEMPVFETTTRLNIRQGPGVIYLTLPESPLEKGVQMNILQTKNGWHMVDILSEVNHEHGLQGWVNGNYIKRG